MSTGSPPEVPLTGGNSTTVVRRGDAVHRTAGPWTPTVHRLLEHVRATGLVGVPRPLGLDEQGREVLSHLPGTVPQDPLPAWVWSDDVLTAAGQLLGALHRATAGLALSGAVWQVPVHEPVEVVCHNDVAPYNLVFDDDHRLTGLIDWDTASPGPRVWDLSYLAYRLVPLAHPDNPDALAGDTAERRRRLELLCASYGAASGEVVSAAAVLAAVPGRLRELADHADARALAGAEHLAAHAALYRRDADWVAEQAAGLSGGNPADTGLRAVRASPP